jgi:acyl-CoA reductase-like NAD-dependent aldehyde dehydrogenase
LNLPEIMSSARAAAAEWGARPVRERVELLAALRGVIAADIDGIVDAIVDATGKVPVDALTGDVMTCLEFIAHYEREAERILAPVERSAPPLYIGSRFTVCYEPLGVVLVLSPWNYPLQLALVPLISALTAGNAVILKPSEVTPFAGDLIEELCARAGVPAGLVQVVQGGPETGAALVASGPDKIFFTGSVETGRLIARAVSETLIPLELELGGKDPLVVFADANLDRAIEAAVYGAFVNAGQVCVGVERAYVERSIYERFVDGVSAAADRLRVGDARERGGAELEVGAIIDPAQRQVIDEHVEDALARGAKATRPFRRDGALYHPLVLRDANHEMRVMREESFGPLLPVMPFDHEEQAIALCNDSIYGLNAAVFTADVARGRRVARRLEVGSCAVNDVLKNIGNPDMPFGGTKQSGYGRYHGDEGLRGFCRQLSLMENGGQLPREVNWFPWGKRVYQTVKSLLEATHRREPAAQTEGKLSRARAMLAGLLGR